MVGSGSTTVPPRVMPVCATLLAKSRAIAAPRLKPTMSIVRSPFVYGLVRSGVAVVVQRSVECVESHLAS